MRACSKPASSEVLRGADEDAGTAADGGAEGAEVAAGLRGEEEDDLLGLVGHGDGDALFADLFVPGLDTEEPVVGGRVGGAAEEGGDEKVVDGLGGGRSGCSQILSPGWRLGTWAMGRVRPARVTWTSILGPARSKRAGSAWRVEQRSRRAARVPMRRDLPGTVAIIPF